MTTKIQHTSTAHVTAHHDATTRSNDVERSKAHGVAELFANDSMSSSARATTKAKAHASKGLGAHLENAGGKIIEHPKVAPMYLGSYWNTPTGQADRSYFDAFTKDLVDNKGYAGVLSQYGVKQASALPSSSLMPDASPKKVTQKQIEKTLRDQMLCGELKSSPNTLHTIYLPPGTQVISDEGRVGGFHGSFKGPNGKPIRYAVVAYASDPIDPKDGVPGSQRARDGTTIGASHEYADAVTDPDVERANKTGRTGFLGWYDFATKFVLQGQKLVGKGEISDVGQIDEGIKSGGPARGGVHSAHGRHNGFAYEGLWSNRDRRVEEAPKRS